METAPVRRFWEAHAPSEYNILVFEALLKRLRFRDL